MAHDRSLSRTAFFDLTLTLEIWIEYDPHLFRRLLSYTSEFFCSHFFSPSALPVCTCRSFHFGSGRLAKPCSALHDEAIDIIYRDIENNPRTIARHISIILKTSPNTGAHTVIWTPTWFIEKVEKAAANTRHNEDHYLGQDGRSVCSH